MFSRKIKFDIYDASSFGMLHFMMYLGIVKAYLARGNYTMWGGKTWVPTLPLRQEIMHAFVDFV
jgi:hypothetical protein